MASHAENEKQHVYLTYRDLFSGSKARVRNRKAIRSIVLKHRAPSDSTADEHHLERTVSILKTLLKDRVFELEIRARKAFPGIFAKSPQVPHATNTLGKPDGRSEGPKSTKRKKHAETITGAAADLSQESSTIQSKEGDCSHLTLHPVLFPFEAQHEVLTRVQRLLEEMCFCFIEKWLPSMLVLHQWTCAAAMELTHALSIIKANLELLPENCMDAGKRTLFIEIAPMVAQLRHAAVHRLHLPCDQFLQQIHSASKLAEVLQHSKNLDLLRSLYSQVHVWTKKLQHDTTLIEQRANCIMAQLSQQRAMIQKREEQLLETVAQKQSELAAAAGTALLQPRDALMCRDRPSSTYKCDAAGNTVDYEMAVDENDIESDEDQLQAELG